MRNFFIFGLIAFCLIMAFGYTPSQYHKQSECAKVNQSEITALGEAIIAGEISPDAIEQKRKEYQAQRDFSATCSDLTAQWTVANLTWRGFMLGVIGLGLLGWTLIETQSAAKSTRKALSVANESLEETKSANIESLRAYLGVTEISFGHSSESSLEFIVKIKNFGATPATKVFIDINVGFMTRDNAWKPLCAGNDIPANIMPDQEVSVHCHGISHNSFINAAPDGINGFDHVAVDGEFDFETFGKMFRIKFSAMTSGLRGDMDHNPRGMTLLDDLTSEEETIATYED